MPKLGEALRAIVSDKEDALEIKGRPESVLMNPTRQRIFENICQYPASRLRPIARRLGMNATVVQFHLRKMKLYDYVSLFSGVEAVSYYPTDLRPAEQDLVLLSILADEVGREIIKLIVEKPGLTPAELAQNAHHSVGATWRILAKMESRGLAAIIIDGRHSRVFPGDGLVRLERRTHQLLRGMKSRLMRRLARDKLSPVVEMDGRRESTIVLNIGGKSHKMKIPTESLMPWMTSR